MKPPMLEQPDASQPLLPPPQRLRRRPGWALCITLEDVLQDPLPPHVPNVLTVREAAALLRVTRQTIYDNINARILPAGRLSGVGTGNIRILVSDFRDYLQQVFGLAPAEDISPPPSTTMSDTFPSTSPSSPSPSLPMGPLRTRLQPNGKLDAAALGRQAGMRKRGRAG